LNRIKLIAEFSWCHMGDMALATEMVHAAKEAGADYAKFQTWKVANLRPGPWDTDGRREIYVQAELTEDKHRLLKETCDRAGIKFMTSVFNPSDLEFGAGLCDEVKIPSPEATNEMLLIGALHLFKHVYLSTGASYFDEYKRWAASDHLTLMHCISSYPLEASNFHMNKLDAIKGLTPRWGFSGHMPTIWDAVTAIGKGAQVVEKHFTIDNNLPGRDNKFALLPKAFKQLREFADQYVEMHASQHLELLPCEENYRLYHKGRWG
jgi:sialic acid synthase SpsE